MSSKTLAIPDIPNVVNGGCLQKLALGYAMHYPGGMMAVVDPQFTRPFQPSHPVGPMLVASLHLAAVGGDAGVAMV